MELKATFDNLEDVQTKFNNTICYYEDKPVIVKSSEISAKDPKDFMLNVITPGGRKYIQVELLTDKKFRYRDYHLGYANGGINPVWWYRKPLKQYHQGLRSNQLGCKNTPGFYGHPDFDLSKPNIDMLTNSYPSLELCQGALRSGERSGIAFSKDFALSWDGIHNDYILHYRAMAIGSSANLRNFNLLDASKHLTEALKEAIG